MTPDKEGLQLPCARAQKSDDMKLNMKLSLSITWFMPYSWISIVVLLLAGCRPNVTQAPDNSLPIDFVQFYTKFHTDSSYQMSSIVFPLNTKVPSDSTDTNYWMPEEWKLHELEGFSTEEYDHSFEKMADDYIIEVHKHKQVPFAVVRRWLKIKDDWKLSYYEVKQGALSGE